MYASATALVCVSQTESQPWNQQQQPGLKDCIQKLEDDHLLTSHWLAVRAFSNVTAKVNVPTIAAHVSRMEEPADLHAIAIVDAAKTMTRLFIQRQRLQR